MRIADLLWRYDTSANVVLFPAAWDQLAYFRNPWEQGEVWHPGLKNFSQSFFDAAGIDLNVDTMVADATVFTFSNFVIAKPIFWADWLKLADQLWSFAEDQPEQLTPYRSGLAPMKAFLQERLLAAVLVRGGAVDVTQGSDSGSGGGDSRFAVVLPDDFQTAPIFTRMFRDDHSQRELLLACNRYKALYRQTSDMAHLEHYYQSRAQIDYREPMA